MSDINDTTEIVPVIDRTVDDCIVQFVNARDLYVFLDVKTQFAHWIQRRIDEYEFSQDIDYFVANFGQGTVNTIEYEITLDMAKELAMLEKSPKGKEIRRYFIECEKRLLHHPSAIKARECAILHEKLAKYRTALYEHEMSIVEHQEAIAALLRKIGYAVQIIKDYYAKLDRPKYPPRNGKGYIEI